MEPASRPLPRRQIEPSEEMDAASASLIELLADWYWEQDEAFRFTSVASALAQATSTAEGLRNALRMICEVEGWDAGRCFRVEPDGEVRFVEGWFARERAIEQMLRGSRVLWEAGKPVWSTDLPRRPG